MLPEAHTTTRGSLAVSAGALEVTASFKALQKCSSLTFSKTFSTTKRVPLQKLRSLLNASEPFKMSMHANCLHGRRPMLRMRELFRYQCHVIWHRTALGFLMINETILIAVYTYSEWNQTQTLLLRTIALLRERKAAEIGRAHV